jgi:hypothetical protein
MGAFVGESQDRTIFMFDYKDTKTVNGCHPTVNFGAIKVE